MANSIIGTHGSIGPGCDADEVADPAPLEDGDDRRRRRRRSTAGS